ncbi:hypothetical protein B0H11DRAFT_355010 [Mycena galericulata]|nr:hypothetical protein B0H11DRAFT_355010 [Mycena galericulata]
MRPAVGTRTLLIRRREKLKDEKAHGKETVRGRRSCSCGYRLTSHLVRQLGIGEGENWRHRLRAKDREIGPSGRCVCASPEVSGPIPAAIQSKNSMLRGCGCPCSGWRRRRCRLWRLGCGGRSSRVQLTAEKREVKIRCTSTHKTARHRRECNSGPFPHFGWCTWNLGVYRLHLREEGTREGARVKGSGWTASTKQGDECGGSRPRNGERSGRKPKRR